MNVDKMTITMTETQAYEDIRSILTQARKNTIKAINNTIVKTYWEIGKYITKVIGDRAEYGKQLLIYLSERLSNEFGSSYSVRNLWYMKQFYNAFPIVNALRSQLSWTHYRLLMRIENLKQREFYLNECVECNWTSRQLERQINSFYYERLLSTQKEYRNEIAEEIFTTEPNKEIEHIIKDPYVLEFLDLNLNIKYHETDLEHALIDKLQEFLLELGKGFSFVARQKRITTEEGNHYYIDLVFYNYILKCFVIIDLKTGDLTFQDVGQIDFYTRLFDDIEKQQGDNPTIGIILCKTKDESIVKYSVLADKDNLFASKYKLYLPTEEQLKAEMKFVEDMIKREKG